MATRNPHRIDVGQGQAGGSQALAREEAGGEESPFQEAGGSEEDLNKAQELRMNGKLAAPSPRMTAFEFRSLGERA